MTKRKNVLFILSDALRHDGLGCYGNTRKVSPVIDNLAEKGILFRNAFTASPVSNSSTTSLFTGCLPKIHGVRHHTAVFGGTCPTMAETFKRNGYHTGAVISCATLDKSRGLARGFDYYDDRFGPEEPKGFKPPDPNKRSISRHSGTAIQLAEQWINSLESTRPFFLFLHLFDTHSPFNPNPDYFEKTPFEYDGPVNGSEKEGVRINQGKIKLSEKDKEYLRYLYEGEIFYTDQKIGQFLTFLKQKSLFEDTVIVFTSDHGCHLGERDLWGSGRRLYDYEIHIPLIIVNAGLGEAKRVGSVVSNIDIFPTLMDVLDFPYKQATSGSSRVKEIVDDSKGYDNVIYSETFMPAWIENRKVCVRNKKWKLIHPVLNEVEKENSVGFRLVKTFSLARTLLYRLLTSKVNRRQQLARALDMLLFKKEKSAFEEIEKRDKKLIGSIIELYDVEADPREENNLYYENVKVAEYLYNELIFLSDKFLKSRTLNKELSGEQLEEAKKMLEEMGYR